MRSANYSAFLTPPPFSMVVQILPFGILWHYWLHLRVLLVEKSGESVLYKAGSKCTKMGDYRLKILAYLDIMVCF